MELLDYILHFRNVLSRVDHRRLLEICEGIEFPEYKIGYDREAMYDMRGHRSQILLSKNNDELYDLCLLYTSPSPRDQVVSRMPSSA